MVELVPTLFVDGEERAGLAATICLHEHWTTGVQSFAGRLGGGDGHQTELWPLFSARSVLYQELAATKAGKEVALRVELRLRLRLTPDSAGIASEGHNFRSGDETFSDGYGDTLIAFPDSEVLAAGECTLCVPASAAPPSGLPACVAGLGDDAWHAEVEAAQLDALKVLCSKSANLGNEIPVKAVALRDWHEEVYFVDVEVEKEVRVQGQAGTIKVTETHKERRTQQVMHGLGVFFRSSRNGWAKNDCGFAIAAISFLGADGLPRSLPLKVEGHGAFSDSAPVNTLTEGDCAAIGFRAADW